MKIINNFIIIISMFLTVNAFAGHETGNGTGDNPYDGVAWFGKRIDDKAINICYQVSENFSKTEIDFEYLIRSRFEIWKKYFLDTYSICKDYQTTTKGTICLQTKYTISSTCDSEVDLKIYFGSEPQNNSDLLKLNKLKKSAGAAVLESFRKENVIWGKGLIWIAPENYYYTGYPNWKDLGVLKTTLLHEIGHVFGSDHVQGTIMEENIYKLFNKIKTKATNYYDKIDWERYLYPKTMALDNETTLLSGYHIQKRNALFEYLYNRPPQGKVRIVYGNSTSTGDLYSFYIQDNLLQDELYVKVVHGPVASSDYGRALTIYAKQYGNKDGLMGINSNGSVGLYTYASRKTGKEVKITGAVNMERKFEAKALWLENRFGELDTFFTTGVAWYEVK